MEKQERVKRIIARGEFSDHCHVITGDAVIIRNEKGEVIIEAGKEGAIIKHLIESDWTEGKETWTQEHLDIPLKEGSYKFVQQLVFDPLTKRIESARD